MRWSKQQIRSARTVTLAPLLIKRGYALKALTVGNYCVCKYDDLIIKHNYWRWPSQNLEGNTIDYFTKVENTTFSQAMQILSHAE